MIAHSDEGPDLDPHDPLAVILRPPTVDLGAPAGRYEAIRRTAARRRLLRAAAGVGAVCAVAALVALPLHLSAAPPTVPLAPPPATSPPHHPTPPEPTRPDPTPSATPAPTRRGPTAEPKTTTPTAAPSLSAPGRTAPTRSAPTPTPSTPPTPRP